MHSNRQCYRHLSGFTLLELVVSSCIVCILLTGTLSAFGPLLDRMRIIRLVADFHGALSRAHNEAVRRSVASGRW